MSTNSNIKEPKDSEVSIDTSKMSEGKRAALELSEAARDTKWEHASFVGELFMGKLNLPLIHPFPVQPQEDIDEGQPFMKKLKHSPHQRT